MPKLDKLPERPHHVWLCRCTQQSSLSNRACMRVKRAKGRSPQNSGDGPKERVDRRNALVSNDWHTNRLINRHARREVLAYRKTSRRQAKIGRALIVYSCCAQKCIDGLTPRIQHDYKWSVTKHNIPCIVLVHMSCQGGRVRQLLLESRAEAQGTWEQQ